MSEWIDQAREKRAIEEEVKYGPIHPGTDPRCFLKEMLLEFLDAMNYCQSAKEKGQISLKQWNTLDESVRLSIALLRKVCLSAFWK